MNWLRDRIRAWLGMDEGPATPSSPEKLGIALSDQAVEMMGRSQPPFAKSQIWSIPNAAPGVMPKRSDGMAMDYGTPPQVAGMLTWAQENSAFSEGIGFFGYPYLAELAQRPEYRRISEIRAREATRKWIRFTGNEEKTKEIEKAFKAFNVQDKFREIAEMDGFFGRAHLFLDLGAETENGLPLIIDKAKIKKGSLRGLRTVEPLWCYPNIYNSTNPLSPTFYKPQNWFVMGVAVHSDRLLTFVGRELPDILKPAYAFGGLSLSQMAKPYVDNWLRARQSVSDLMHSFSVMVLKTNMAQALSGAVAAMKSLMNRVLAFNKMRDNSGTFVIDKDSEEFANVSAPISGLDKLQAQAQEQMASVTGIPLVVLLGVTPSGLNASSDGEIKSFYADIHAYQEDIFRPNLTVVLKVMQLHLFGDIDPEISFEFEKLWEVSEQEEATIGKTEAETAAILIDAGVISNEEERKRQNNQEGGTYHGQLDGEAPEMPEKDPVDEYGNLDEAA